ncbi:MAG TPA: hypothetical protein DIW82_04570 [Corynebacterium nuruki]|uniref:Uncharacterized protein n=1 Tax=Corynebacterium nuruki TaxID=1032851 RepID=A0A3D4SXR3_9CORY|nr:hypothetical protein [Corynebacterium nuruki]
MSGGLCDAVCLRLVENTDDGTGLAVDRPVEVRRQFFRHRTELEIVNLSEDRNREAERVFDLVVDDFLRPMWGCRFGWGASNLYHDDLVELSLAIDLFVDPGLFGAVGS